MTIFHALLSRRLSVVVACLGLVACGGLVPGANAPAPDLYTLSPKSTFDETLPEVRAQLVVPEPLAARGLDTDRIALRPAALRVDYFADSNWTDRAPKLVQTLLIESFENTKRVLSVGPEAIGLRADYSVVGELREFQAEYDGVADAAPSVRIRLNVKLVRLPEAVIVSSETFEYSQRAGGTDMASIVGAFDLALGKVLRRVVEASVREVSENWRDR